MRTPSSHERLVARLVSDARPVRRLWPPWGRLAAWLVLQAAVLAAVAWVGLRPDVQERTRDPRFLIELLGLAAAATALAVLALRAAVPGDEAGWLQHAVIGVLAVGSAAIAFARPLNVDLPLADFLRTGIACALRTAGLAVIPWCALAVALRRGAPLAAARAGALAGGGALLMSYCLMRIACRIDEPLHLTIWHAFPVLVGIGISALVGLLWFPRWRSRIPR
jgi:hypothetical protein